MSFDWRFFIDLGIISVALLTATFIRSKVSFFQRFLIPNALTAGFLLLPFYNFVAPNIGMGSDGLGSMVYHLLSISFIAMTLRRSKRSGRKGDARIFSTVTGILSQYALQTLVGLLLTVLFIRTFAPDLMYAFGLLLPLGFALGPGQAYAIGSGWENLGFDGAATIGLTFAAVGFLWACFGGVFLINYAIRKGWMSKQEISAIRASDTKVGVHPPGTKLPVGAKLTTETEAIDSMTFNLAHILLVYVITFFFLKAAEWALGFAGDMGRDIAASLWGISFIFGALTAMIYKRVVRKLRVDYTLDNGSLTRVTGLSVDVMVTGSIAAISIAVVQQFWLPILILCVIGGTMAIVTVPWMCSRLFRDHRFHRTLIIFGVSTGTMPTGFALLRVIDPEFETPVARDYIHATAITFALAVPFLLTINFPIYALTRGNPLWFWLTVAVAGGYLLLVAGSYFFLTKRRGIEDPANIWLHRGRD